MRMQAQKDFNRNYSLDMLKLLLALLVVVRHSPSVYKEMLYPMTTCAVPVFFMVSGFFVLNGQVTIERLKKSIKRIIQIFSVAVIVYYVEWSLRHGEAYVPTLKDVLLFLACNDVAFAGHLWYLSAYVYVLFSILLLVRYGKQHWLFWIVPILLVVYYVADLAYLAMANRQYMTATIMTRNWLFTGLPFFVLGSWESLCRSHRRCWMWMIMLLLAFVEYDILHLTNHIGDVFLMTLPLTLTFFAWYQSKHMQKENILSVWGRRYSLYIYIIHPIVIHLCRFCLEDGLVKDWLQPIIVFIVSLFLSMVYVAMKRTTISLFCKTR